MSQIKLDKVQQKHKKSQGQLVLEWLQGGKSLTKLQALRDMGIMQLGSRIAEIRMFLGQDCIDTEFVNGRHGKRYAKYRWVEEQR